MLKLPLFLRFILRDLRSGELSLLCMALFLAVTCMSAMQQFSEIVHAEGQRQAAAFLGADAVVTRHEAIPKAWMQEAQKLGLQQTITINFLSMAVYHKKLQLVQVKAVDGHYPLRGKLAISAEPPIESAHAPKVGTTWITPRLLPMLSMQSGDSFAIGAATFHIEGLIVDSPGQRGDWLSISPQMLMNIKDVPKTQVLQLGSKVTYNWLLMGEGRRLSQLKQFLQGTLGDHLQWSDSQQGTPAIDALIQRTMSYLNLGTLMSLLLGGVAISMATLRYSQRHLQQVALLRCFGATQHHVSQLYFLGLFVVGMICTLGGILMGLVLQPVLMKWLGGIFSTKTYSIQYAPMVFSFFIGMLLLIGFSLGNLWELRKITAMQIFARRHEVWMGQLWPTYLFAFILLMGLGYFYTYSWVVTIFVIMGMIVFIGVVLLTLWLFSLVTSLTKAGIPLSLRFGFNNIARNQENSALQITAIGLALTAMLTLGVFKNNVLDAWQRELPPNTANYFLINIAPEQVLPLKSFLHTSGVETTDIYPMVRGRLTSINGQSVQRIFGERIKDINALQRELNFSWSDTLPIGNQLIAGAWPVGGDANRNWVSIEAGLAERLKLRLGDKVGVQIEQESLDAVVTSIRTVDWQSFKPNFFMLFKPGLLNHFSQTMITSFYLPPSETLILAQLAQQFPNVTLIDVASTLKKVREMIEQIGYAMNFMAVFCFLIGLIIAALAVLSFNTTKQEETRLLKVLGMRQRTLLWIRSSEAIMLGLYTGLLACAISLGMCYALSIHFLGRSFDLPWQLLLTVPMMTALLNLSLNGLIQYQQYRRKTTPS